MNQSLSVEEVNLIKKWKDEPNDNIALYFFNKYKDDILSINYSKIKLKFSSIPLEKEDFFYQVWKSCLELLKDYDFKKGGSFKNLLIRKTYQASIKEALKFVRNSHIVLNNSYSYDKLVSDNRNFNPGKNGRVEINDDFFTGTKEFIDYVVSFNKEYKPNYVKQVLFLKSCGYSVEQIAKRLRRSVREVTRLIKYICKISKKLYE